MQQAIRQFLFSIQKFVAPRRIGITKIFFFVEILILLLWAVGGMLLYSDFDTYFLPIYDIGRRLGPIALVCYVITMIPGINTRLQWFPLVTQPLSGIIHPFRRHFGITMFLTAFVHMSFTTTMAFVISSGFDLLSLKLARFQLMGLIAWILLFPLWLTSNDTSVKYLGKWWKRIHRLTYIALFFIFLHVALQRSDYLLLIAPMAVLQVISWIVYWMRPRKPVMAPAPTQPVVQQPVGQQTIASTQKPTSKI
jgi:sulfoxide reductase heme-binding subunit YedZ